jgi:hypothetical protein
MIELKKLAESAKQKETISLEGLQLREKLKCVLEEERLGKSDTGIKELNTAPTPKNLSLEPMDSPIIGTKKLGVLRTTVALPHIFWRDNGFSEADKENTLPY